MLDFDKAKQVKLPRLFVVDFDAYKPNPATAKGGGRARIIIDFEGISLRAFVLDGYLSDGVGFAYPVEPEVAGRLLLGLTRVVEELDADTLRVRNWTLGDRRGFYWIDIEKHGDVHFAVPSPVDPWPASGPSGTEAYRRENIKLLGGPWVAPEDCERPGRLYINGWDMAQSWKLDLRWENWSWRLEQAERKGL